MEDDKAALLETQLAQAKQIAEEADKKYEEVNKPASNHSTMGFKGSLLSHSTVICLYSRFS